jgi:peptidoglycan/xylan/chitin deacetylase (PgdA/CDA1 family)
MRLLHNIGEIKHSNYHTREQVLNSNEPLGFDGIYLNVYENRDILKNKTGVFFVMGNFVGEDNSFDLEFVPKLEKYCTWKQINEMCSEYDFEIGWHTWSHPDLTLLNKEQIIKEITPPFPIKYFAYPYGRFNDLAIECVKEIGYEKAWSVTQGSKNINDINHNYKIYRPYL